jgi:hypothetical protein
LKVEKVMVTIGGVIHTLCWQQWMELANCVHDLEGGQAYESRYGSTRIEMFPADKVPPH